MTFEKIDITIEQWQAIFETLPDCEIFHSSAWLSFLVASQRGELVFAALKEGEKTIGYFTGMIVQRFGLKILGSPFPGWTTPNMGFHFLGPVEPSQALRALATFAFERLGCYHIEIVDRRLTEEDVRDSGFLHRQLSSFEIDLSQDEETLFRKMTGPCRSCVRKARKSGVTIEEATDLGFVDDYYAQLQDVFAKHALVPTYPIERVRELCRCLLPTGQLLLLRARDPEGRCIASGIFPALNRTMYFWGGASWRRHQILRPNELLLWHAMMFWKARGIRCFDMNGEGEYKRKYGGHDITVQRLIKSKYAWITNMRDLAKRAVRARQTILGRRSLATVNQRREAGGR